jgi:hypothetical protein
MDIATEKARVFAPVLVFQAGLKFAIIASSLPLKLVIFKTYKISD